MVVYRELLDALVCFVGEYDAGHVMVSTDMRARAAIAAGSEALALERQSKAATPAVEAVSEGASLQIDRTCPKCGVFGSCYWHPIVPPAYGQQTKNSVLARCQNGQCQHEWRALLRPSEREALSTIPTVQGDASKSLRRIFDALPREPKCRDCADEDGTCPSLKRPCDPVEWVIQLIGNALSPTPASVETAREEIARVVDPRTWASYDRKIAEAVELDAQPLGAVRAADLRNEAAGMVKASLATAHQILSLISKPGSGEGR